MRAALASVAAVVLLPLVTLPVGAKVLAEGKPTSGGLYWQKIERTDGKVVYLCRAKNDSKIQKSASCTSAGAKKP